MIGIICATDSEFEIIQQHVDNFQKQEILARVFYTGTLHGKRVVINKSGIGKVASTLTVAAMAMAYGITSLIFVGTAGATGGAGEDRRYRCFKRVRAARLRRKTVC